MRLKRISKAVAVGAALGLVLSACAPGGEGNTDASPSSESTGKFTVEPTNTGLADLGDIETKDGSISYSVGAEDFISYNGLTPESYSTYNSAVVDRMLVGFSYFGTDGAIYPNEDLGTYEVVSEDPMTVKYTINPEAKWSDGTDITVADAVLAWATQNVNLAKGDTPLFNSVSQDLGDTVPKGPEGDPMGKEFTLTYANPDPDYAIQVLMAQPAHVVAEQGGLSVEEFVEAARAGDSAKLEKAAEFWNTGWTTSPGTLPDEELIPVNGPYKLSSWEPGQSVTLVANENYYGTPAATKELVIRFTAPDTMVQALQNGDIDVIEPQATVDTLAQLEGLGEENVQVHTGDSLTWEHLDFNFGDGALFADNLELRKAFAMCVPRQQIVDNLIKPLNPEAEVMNAREVFTFQEKYDEIVGEAYSGQYDEVDIEGAKAIVDEEGATGKKVRIGYSSPNPRRTEQVAMIKSSCDQAGFEIVDGGDAKFFAPGGSLERGDFEVALFAWAGSGQITSGQNIYATGKPQNYGQYSNEEVDAAWQRLATSLDTEVHLEETKNIEKLLWDDLFGIPVFAHPGLGASAADVLNVRDTAAQGGIVWNAEQWVRAE